MIDVETLKRWEYEYIEDVNLDDRLYLNLNKEEMINFIKNNYYDKINNCFVTGKSYGMVMGLQYIDTACMLTRGESIRYLICVSKNNKGTYTILSDIIYHDNCLNVVDNQVIPVTLLEYSECNQYFRNRGLNKSTLNVFAHTIDYDKMLLTTSLSVLGYRYHVFDSLKELMLENGFDKDIRMLSGIDQEYMDTLCGKKPLTLKK